jgi:DNA-directed RNA polymerase subunit alpha
MKEDTIEFLLNVKALRLRPRASWTGKLHLDAVGEGRVLAGDIQPSGDFEVVNPGLHLATLDSPEARLMVEFNVEQGKGFLRAGRGDELPIGVIPVDAIFSPIRKVNFTVEPTRVGQVSTYERLILEVWTDGTISPIDAVSQVAQLLIGQFQLFCELAMVSERMEERKPRLPIASEQYNMPIDQLNFSVRTANCLRRVGITKLGDLLEKDEKELLAIRNFGQRALEEVREQLKDLGLTIEGTDEGTEGEEDSEE